MVFPAEPDPAPPGKTHKESGGGRIRTYETLAGLAVFKTARFNHSRTPPLSP